MAIWKLIIAFIDLRLFLLTIFTFLLALLVIKILRPKNLPPGPWSLPLLGYLPNIFIYSRWYGIPLPAVLSRLSRRYGSIFSLYLGDQLCVVLNSQDAIKEAFMNPKLNDRPTAAHFQNNEETGILNASGQNWRDQRSFTHGIFRRFGVGKASFETQICSELQMLLKQFEREKSFNPTKLICTAISNIISRVTVGRRYDYEAQEFRQLLDLVNRIVALAGSAGFKNIVKILRLLPSKSNQELAKSKEEFMKIVHDNIVRRQAQYEAGTIECLIDVYLSRLDTKEELGPHINNETIKKTVASLFAAGTDTSCYQILWILVYLLRHHDILKKVQQEIDTVVGRDRLPRMSDKPDMPFTQAVIMEIMRLTATVPMGVMHAASQDTTLRGYSIPKGTMLIANLWGVHNDPATWSEPSKFDPGRFLDENGAVMDNESLIPFSAGRRICLGENLAKMEIFLFITHILHQFDLKVPEGEPEPSLEGNFVLNYSTKPFVMTTTKRE